MLGFDVELCRGLTNEGVHLFVLTRREERARSKLAPWVWTPRSRQDSVRHVQVDLF